MYIDLLRSPALARVNDLPLSAGATVATPIPDEAAPAVRQASRQCSPANHAESTSVYCLDTFSFGCYCGVDGALSSAIADTALVRPLHTEQVLSGTVARPVAGSDIRAAAAASSGARVTLLARRLRFRVGIWALPSPKVHDMG